MRLFSGSARILMQNVTLWGATAAFMSLLPVAYGQQEIDPTWYDPWAAPSKAVIQAAQPRTPNRNSKEKTNSAPHEHGKKLDPKRSASGQGKALCQNGASNGSLSRVGDKAPRDCEQNPTSRDTMHFGEF